MHVVRLLATQHQILLALSNFSFRFSIITNSVCLLMLELESMMLQLFQSLSQLKTSAAPSNCLITDNLRKLILCEIFQLRLWLTSQTISPTSNMNGQLLEVSTIRGTLLSDSRKLKSMAAVCSIPLLTI